MSQSNRRQLIIQPDIDIHPEIGRALWMLETTRQRLNDLLDIVNPNSLDWLPDWSQHSIGTLLYHIALVETDWLYVEVLGHPYDQPYPGDIAALFPYPMRTDNALTRVTGLGMDEHRRRLAAVRRALLDVYRAMTPDDFRRPRAQPDYDVTPEWVLFHLSEHETEHRAEIAVLRTQFAREKASST
jgi:uncharacterized damage-inducible protein DinB